MNQPKARPPRQSKFVHESPAPDLRCDFAVLPFDRAVREMERKWGVNRLVSLVSTATAVKWGSAMEKLNAAIDARDAEEIAARAAVCVRGLQAMDSEAEGAGAVEVPPGALTGAVGGFRFVIVPDGRCWPQYQDQFPDHVMVTLEQAGSAIKAHIENSPVVGEVRKHFPDAEVKQLKPEQTVLERDLEDEIPF